MSDLTITEMCNSVILAFISLMKMANSLRGFVTRVQRQILAGSGVARRSIFLLNLIQLFQLKYNFWSSIVWHSLTQATISRKQHQCCIPALPNQVRSVFIRHPNPIRQNLHMHSFTVVYTVYVKGIVHPEITLYIYIIISAKPNIRENSQVLLKFRSLSKRARETKSTKALLHRCFYQQVV